MGRNQLFRHTPPRLVLERTNSLGEVRCATIPSVMGARHQTALVTLICLAFPLSAEQPHERLASTLRIWQKRLHLESWNISVSLAAPHDLGEGLLGYVEWNDTPGNRAEIRVLDPKQDSDQLSLEEAWAECEVTVVHELVHLSLAGLTEAVDQDQEETVVSDLTEALLATGGPVASWRTVPWRP